MTGRFLRACRREPVDRTPIWLMRQTGRWLPEYRDLRARHSLPVILASPDLIVEATLLPLHRLAVDAAPVFTDPLLLLEALGLQVAREDGAAPLPDLRGNAEVGRGGSARSFATPVRSVPDIDRLRPVTPREATVLQPTLQAIERLRDGLRGPTLLAMAEAPFTLAAYAIEGGTPKSFEATKALMHTEPALWHRLCAVMATTVADWLVAQIEAGAGAAQMSDAWSQALTAAEYEAFALPHSRAVCDRVARCGVPLIHYGTGTNVLEGLAAAGGDVIGVDWRTPLDEAWERIGTERGVQGNLAPTALIAPFEQMLEAVNDVLARADGRPGHVFNLGHGLLASTPVEHVTALIRYVQLQSER